MAGRGVVWSDRAALLLGCFGAATGVSITSARVTAALLGT